MIDHSLAFCLLFCKPLLFLFLFHKVSSGFFPGELFNSLFFCEFLLSGHGLHFYLFLVSTNKVGFHLLSSFLTSEFTLLLAFEIFIYLTFNKFSFEHFFFQCFDVVEFEFFKLIGDAFCVSNFVFVFLLQFGLHLFVICGHLILFHIDPLLIDLCLNCLFAFFKLLLSALFVSNITHHHFGF